MRGNTKHIGNHHPPPRNIHRPAFGGTGNKTAPSPLAKVDHDSQTHVRQSHGHSMGIHDTHDCGYARPIHHADQFKRK